MAEGQALTEELAQIKLHTGIVGVVFLIVGVKLVACGLAAVILHDQTFQYPMYSMGLLLAGFVIGLWALYSSVCYLTVSYKGKGKEKQLYLRMVGYMLQWSIFACYVHIGTIAILGVSLNTGSDADIRVRAITITCIVGCGISGVFSFFGLFSMLKCVGKLGLPIDPPTKTFVVVAFKNHGCALMIISVHQIVWALVALIVPQFGGREYPLRIAAFSLGGIVNPIMATVTASLCFKLVKFANNPKEKSRVMTKTMVEVHKAWIWAFIGINIAGTGTYGGCFGTLQDEHGNWTITAPFYVVVGHVLSLIGNILIGHLYFCVAHYEQFQGQLALTTNVKPKTQASTSNNTTSGAAAKKTAKPAASKPAPKKASTTTKDAKASDATSNTNTPASTGTTATSSGATATPSGVTGASAPVAGTSSGETTNIEEMKERNRLLQEEVALQLQLKELRQQQQQAPNQSVLYTSNTVQLGPTAPGMPPIYVISAEDAAPPSYDDVTSYPAKPN